MDEFPDVKIFVKYATEHRCGICIRGNNLSDQITGTDPLRDNLALLECKPKVDEAKRTADIVNCLSHKLRKVLENHEINRFRKAEGKPLANIILFRGGGTRLDLPPFEIEHPQLSADGKYKSFAIAPTCMISGWMQTIGIEVIKKGLEKATGDYRTDVDLKGDCAVALLTENSDWSKFTDRDMNSSRYSFCFLHIKAVDDAGHDGLLDKKIEFIEKIDSMIGKVRSRFETSSNDYSIVITADHSTPI